MNTNYAHTHWKWSHDDGYLNRSYDSAIRLSLHLTKMWRSNGFHTGNAHEQINFGERDLTGIVNSKVKLSYSLAIHSSGLKFFFKSIWSLRWMNVLTSTTRRYTIFDRTLSDFSPSMFGHYAGLSHHFRRMVAMANSAEVTTKWETIASFRRFSFSFRSSFVYAFKYPRAKRKIENSFR